jgi:hypothetical protein
MMESSRRPRAHSDHVIDNDGGDDSFPPSLTTRRLFSSDDGGFFIRDSRGNSSRNEDSRANSSRFSDSRTSSDQNIVGSSKASTPKQVTFGDDLVRSSASAPHFRRGDRSGTASPAPVLTRSFDKLRNDRRGDLSNTALSSRSWVTPMSTRSTDSDARRRLRSTTTKSPKPTFEKSMSSDSLSTLSAASTTKNTMAFYERQLFGANEDANNGGARSTTLAEKSTTASSSRK